MFWYMLFCVISPNSIAFEADCVTVVEDRLIMSAEYCLLLLAKTEPCSSCSLCMIAELLVRVLLLGCWKEYLTVIKFKTPVLLEIKY